jgi:hypothetical protein
LRPVRRSSAAYRCSQRRSRQAIGVALAAKDDLGDGGVIARGIAQAARHAPKCPCLFRLLILATPQVTLRFESPR